MSENILKNYSEYLNKQGEKLSEILEYSKSKNFQKTEQEVEHIRLYLRKRERLFSELNEITKSIKQIESSENLTNTPKEIQDIISKNKQIITQIINIDNVNKKIFEEIYSIVKESIKSTKETAKISIKYSGVYDSSFMGTNFDSSR